MLAAAQSIESVETQLFELERIDRAQRLLETPKNLCVGSVVIAPVALLLIAAEIGWGTQAAKYIAISAGFAFIGFLLLASVLNITQWFVARRLLCRVRLFDTRLIEQFPLETERDIPFGPFRVERDSAAGRISGTRPHIAIWRLYRPILAVLAFLAFLGYIFVLIPSVLGSVSIYDLVKMTLATLMCLVTIWYARLPQVISWRLDLIEHELSLTQLIGFLGTQRVVIDSDRVTKLVRRPTGRLTGEYRFELESDAKRIILPIDSIRVKPKTMHHRSNIAMSRIRLIRLLMLLGYPELLPDDAIRDPNLDLMISS